MALKCDRIVYDVLLLCIKKLFTNFRDSSTGFSHTGHYSCVHFQSVDGKHSTAPASGPTLPFLHPSILSHWLTVKLEMESGPEIQAGGLTILY